MYMISQNVEVIPYHTGQRWDRENSTMCQTITNPPPCFTMGRRQWCLYSQSFSAVGKREKLDSSEDITCFHWSADQLLWSLHHLNLFWMLVVESSDFLMAALPLYPDLLSLRRTVFVEARLFKCWFNSAVTLAAVVRCFLPTMRLNARRFLSVAWKFARNYSGYWRFFRTFRISS